MAASKEKQNMRFQRVSQRIFSKVRYDGFRPEQVKYIKLVREYQCLDIELNRFYRDCKRTETGSVDWDTLDVKTLDWFDFIYKKHEKMQSKISKLEERIDGSEVMRLFMELNCNSVCF